MKFLIRIIFCMLPVYLNAVAQNGNYELGARSLGLSGANITLTDAYSGFNNIGALADHHGTSVCFSSSMLYGIPDLLKIGLGFTGELFNGIGCVNLYRFGDQHLSEHKIGVGYSQRIRFISLGVQLSYIQFLISGYGSAASLSLEIGGLIEFSPKFLLGGYLFHPLLSGQRFGQLNFLPTILKTGLSYRPSGNLMTNVEYKWNGNMEHSLILGIEYLVRGKVALMTGLNTKSLQSTMGLGFSPGKFRLDFAIMIHPVLGISQEFSVNINFQHP